MRLILRYPNGTRVEALLLARDETRLRITIHGCEETIELTLEEGHWKDEAGQRLALEAIIPPPPMARARAAGGQ